MRNISDVEKYKLVSLLIIAAATCFTVYFLYREIFVAYLELVRLENYSYLIALAPISLWVFVKIVFSDFDLAGVNIFRLLMSTILILSSVVLYILGDVVSYLYIELKSLSLICLLWALTAFFFRPRSITISALSLLLLLLFIPIPSVFTDYLSSMLTDVITPIVTDVTGVQTVVHRGVRMFVVPSPSGIAYLELAPMCSGIVSIYSVLAIAPALVYIAMKSPKKLVRKVLSVVVPLVSAVAIAFSGNTLRIILMVEIAKRMGSETALTFFHYTPSAIYVAIATLVALTLANKFAGQTRPTSMSVHVAGVFRPSAAFYLAIVLCLVFAGLFNALTPTLASDALTQLVAPASSLSKLLESPTAAFLDLSNAVVFRDVPEPKLSQVLGIPAVRSIGFIYNGTPFLGYIEVADTPTKFHGWYVCVTVQGYEIERSWIETGTVTIYHMIISKGSTKLLLSYTIYRLTLPEGVTYARVSLMTPVNDYTIWTAIEISREVLAEATSASRYASPYISILDVVIVALNILVAVGITVTILYPLGRYIVLRHSKATITRLRY